MSQVIDLDAYLARIGWTGSLSPTLEVLRALVARHTAAIAFENLDPFLGRPVSLEPAAIERKLVDEGRGGYCYEHNLLFLRVLETIGFAPRGLAARVLWGRSPGAVTPRSHMLLRLELEGATHLVDVGFGGLTVTDVLRLEPGSVQPTPHGPFRLTELEGDWLLEAEVAGEWRPLYRFDLQHQHPLDYEAINYFVSTHPSSHFVTGLIAARAAPDRRLTLRDRSFAVHRPGASERRSLESTAELRAVLERELLIRLPDDPALDARLEALPR